MAVHPKYRTIGLGAKLIREALPSVGTPFIEMIAVMAKHNLFAEKAGTEKVLEQRPSEEAKRVANALSGFGFDLKLLGSRKHVSDKLQSLTPKQVESLKSTFIKNDHPRFRRECAANRPSPHGSASAYAEDVRNASADRMTRLVKITGMLLQTKVYLFWRKS